MNRNSILIFFYHPGVPGTRKAGVVTVLLWPAAYQLQAVGGTKVPTRRIDFQWRIKYLTDKVF